MKTPRRLLITGLLCLYLCLSFAGFAGVQAAAEQELPKLLVTTTPSPVALMDASNIAAGTSTTGCYISSYNWFDSATGAVLTGSFGTQNYRVEIQVSTFDGYYFAGNVDVYLNNSPVQYILDPGLRTLTLYRDYAPEVWAPTVIKNPGGETVDPGGFASFVATATCTDGYAWYLTSPDGGTTYSCDELYSVFPGVTTSYNGTEKMNIHNIPVEMDGWRIRCTFSGPGGDANSGYATIRVNHEEEPEPTKAEETAPPTATPAPEGSPAPSESASAGDGHTHQYGEAWQYDGNTHWKACSCGDKAEEAAHTMVWTLVDKATKTAPGSEEGRCSVCGYSTRRSVEYSGGEESSVARYMVWGIGALVALTIVVLIVDSIAKNRRRRRRRRR